MTELHAPSLSGIDAAHAKPIDQIAQALVVDLDTGLDAEEAGCRREVTGPNRIKEDPGPSRAQLLGRQFKDVLVLVLLAAALISGVFLGDWLEAAVIVAIVIINAAIGFTQEAKAADAAEGLRRLTSPMAKVLRSGLEHEIPTEQIVPGDVVIIETGDRIFADARLIDVARLQTDESELTGESTPIHKSTEPVPVESVIGDRTSMVFSGTVAAAGRGIGLVTATGADTEIGRIAGMLREEEPPTPLERELAHVGRRLGILAGVVAVVVLGVGVVQGRAVESMFLLAVALAVAAIPEGLPAVVGVTLGRGVQTMARRNAIVRRMPAVEALGAVTVICTDKTGTLTRNQIRVQEIRIEDDLITDVEAAPHDSRLRRFSSLATLCNDARRSDEGWKGDPTEVALIRVATKLSDPSQTRDSWPRIDEFPFESERKRMVTIHCSDDGYLIAVKGAPEVVLPRCQRVEAADGLMGVTEGRRSQWLQAAEDMAARGLRTLALAYRNTERPPDTLSEAEEDLVLVALVGMSD